MEIDVLFASVAVRDLDLSRAWYDRFCSRPADIVPNGGEVIWKATDTAWVYVIRDSARVGHGVITLAVSNLEDSTSALATRGVIAGPIERVGDASRRIFTRTSIVCERHASSRQRISKLRDRVGPMPCSVTS